MKNKKIITLFFATLAFSFGLAIATPVHVHAAGSTSDDNYGLNTTGGQAYGAEVTQNGGQKGIALIIGTVIKGALTLVGVVFLVLMVYAGYLWMIARGNEEKVTRALDTIKAAVIGIVIVAAAYAITSYVISNIVPAATSSGTPTTTI